MAEDCKALGKEHDFPIGQFGGPIISGPCKACGFDINSIAKDAFLKLLPPCKPPLPLFRYDRTRKKES